MAETASESPLHEAFYSQSAAITEGIGPDQIISFCRLAFICQTCRLTTKPVEEKLTTADCLATGADPDEQLFLEDALADSPSEQRYFNELITSATPAWQAEAQAIATRCSASLDPSAGCLGEPVLVAVRHDLDPEA